MKKQVREWLSFAEVDLLTARKLLDDEHLARSTAFHCHQAVEKALKAVIEDCGVRIPKIHDLKKLMSVVEEKEIRLQIDSEELDPLNSVYIDTRYPTDQGLVPNGMPSLGTVRQLLGESRIRKDGLTGASGPTKTPELSKDPESSEAPSNHKGCQADDAREGS